MRGRTRWLVATIVLAGVGAACGARVSPEQVESLSSGRSGPSSDRTPTSTVSMAAAGGEGGGAAESPGAGASGVPSVAATPTAQAPADNGGSTDVGVTASTITLGDVTTLSGPVPGLFEGAVFGTQAAVAYQNSLGGVHGRKLKLDIRDDQFDTAKNRLETVDLLSKAFAMVGSFSVVDDAAVSELEARRVPDVQMAVSAGLNRSPMNFSIAPIQRGYPTGSWNALKAAFPQSIGSAAVLYTDVSAGRDVWENAKYASLAAGYKWVYERGIQATETDFTADVVRMRSAGVRFVFSLLDPTNSARLFKAMAQQNLHPDVVAAVDAYAANTIPLAGAAAEGLINVDTQAMFMGEDAPANPEIRLLEQWVDKVKPGFKPDLFTVYGWASTRLFVQALEAAGPRATRASLLSALSKITSFDANGLLAESGPGDKRPTTCFILTRVHNGKWERYLSPPAPKFTCDNSVYVRRP